MMINRIGPSFAEFLKTNFESFQSPKNPPDNAKDTVKNWLDSVMRLTQEQQVSQTNEPTPDELAFFIKLDKDKASRPRIPESILSNADPQAATEKYLNNAVDKYYVYFKDIEDQNANPNPKPGEKMVPARPLAEIQALAEERDRLKTKIIGEFRKEYGDALKSVTKESKKTPMSETEIKAKATAKAVERWNSRNLYGDRKAQEKAKIDEDLTLFVRGKNDADDVELNDVNQGQVGDCFILAALGAIAKQHPEKIKQIITDNGDGSFNVKIYKPDLSGNYVGTTQKVDGKLVGDGHAKYGDMAKTNGKEQKEAWTVLIEKAYIQANGSYSEANKGGSARNVLTAITGKEAITKKDYKPEELVGLLTSGKAVVMSTPENLDGLNGQTKNKFQNTYKLVTQHAYVLSEVKKDDKGRDIAVLYNPWGTQHAEVPLSDIRDMFPFLTSEQ